MLYKATNSVIKCFDDYSAIASEPILRTEQQKLLKTYITMK